MVKIIDPKERKLKFINQIRKWPHGQVTYLGRGEIRKETYNGQKMTKEGQGYKCQSIKIY